MKTLVAATLVLSACEMSAMEPLDSTQNDQTQYNGLAMNGLANNGLAMNGLAMNGLAMNGLAMNGLAMNGLAMNGLAMNGSQLSAYVNGNPSQLVSGTGMVGAVMTVTVSGTYQVLVKINNIYSDPLSTTGDVFLYDVSYQNVGTNTWTSLCQDASGNPVPGIPIANYWNMTTGARTDDPGAITFACVNGAIGKCVRWGYRPWATSTRCSGGTCSQVSLQDYHQACTRMVRADYCGNGQGNTVNGTAIDVYDGLDPQIQSPASSWTVEARWTPSGATCIGNTRGADLIKKFQYPDCTNKGKNPGYSKSNPFPVCAEYDYSVTGNDLLGNNYNSAFAQGAKAK